ncbi:uncharacterized protein LOC116346166 [Contarinia nasturtii]|uniref:uncharacterized protein LOC116346166 n=1 Tax=Contarinia nasturtii TaxID=265458 RepID=UPI0012D4036D|nr:uncharacterized protein LOC116346166 [Contarinia nasturtii]
MADQGRKSGVKRRSEESNDPEPKRQRIDDAVDATTDGIKLTDIIDDCLERIFIHSSFDDLLNIAHTNTQLMSAAGTTFKRKFGKTKFGLCDDFPPFQENCILITDKKTQLQLLRSFGHLITELTVELSGKFGKKLITYSSEYCFTSLTVLRIQYSDIELLPKKPFANVEVVELLNSRLYEDMDFNKWFPAMRRLNLIKCHVDNKMFVVKNCLHLEQLKVERCNHISTKDFFSFLQNNPQLRSLSLVKDYIPKDFWITCQKLTQLEYLNLECYSLPSSSTAVSLIALKKLDIDIRRNEGILVFLSELTFDQLEDITFGSSVFLNQTSRDTYQWSNFFKKNSSIEKVTLTGYNHSIDNIVTGIIRESPLLKEFNNFGCLFSVDEILDFMGKFNLTSYGFGVENNSEFEDLKNRLSAEWEASFNDGRVIVTRKE